jgi:hypothetical protein
MYSDDKSRGENKGSGFGGVKIEYWMCYSPAADLSKFIHLSES